MFVGPRFCKGLSKRFKDLAAAEAQLPSLPAETEELNEYGQKLQVEPKVLQDIIRDPNLDLRTSRDV